MKTGTKVLIGCLSAPFVLALLLALSVLSFKLIPMAPSRTETAALEQPVGTTATVTEQQLAAEGLVAGGAAPSGPALEVRMHLEEGSFRIVSAPAGTPIRVEGDYDSGAYDLKQEMAGAGTDHPVYTLSFRPKYTMLRRLLSHGAVHFEDGMNPLTIYLPQGVPINLDARIMKGESHLELGGLALTRVKLDLSMGEHEIDAQQPNPLEMDEMIINAGMGETRSSNLGNLRAGSITFFGKMGETGLDLGDQVLRDTKVYARLKMGEMRIAVPADAKLNSRSAVFLGEANGDPDDGGAPRPGQPEPKYKVDVDAGATMGELRVQKNPPVDREL